MPLTHLLVDLEDKHGNFVPREWRSQKENAVHCGSFQNINAVRGFRSRVDALE